MIAKHFWSLTSPVLTKAYSSWPLLGHLLRRSRFRGLSERAHFSAHLCKGSLHLVYLKCSGSVSISLKSKKQLKIVSTVRGSYNNDLSNRAAQCCGTVTFWYGSGSFSDFSFSFVRFSSSFVLRLQFLTYRNFEENFKIKTSFTLISGSGSGSGSAILMPHITQCHI